MLMCLCKKSVYTCSRTHYLYQHMYDCMYNNIHDDCIFLNLILCQNYTMLYICMLCVEIAVYFSEICARSLLLEQHYVKILDSILNLLDSQPTIMLIFKYTEVFVICSVMYHF